MLPLQLNAIDRPPAVCRILGPHPFLLNILSTLFHCLVSSKSPEKSEAILSLFSRPLASSLWISAVGCFSFYFSNSEFLKSHSFLSSIFTQSPWTMVSPVVLSYRGSLVSEQLFCCCPVPSIFLCKGTPAALDRPNRHTGRRPLRSLCGLRWDVC